MKKTLLLLGFTLGLLLAPASLAEQGITDVDALDALKAAHPEYAVAAQQQCGDTAAAVLSLEGSNILCVAENRNGVWFVTIDNPTALRQGEQAPSLFLETDSFLCWSYDDEAGVCTYSAAKAKGAWGDVSRNFTTPVVDGYYEDFSVTLQYVGFDRALLRSACQLDEDGDIAYQWASMPVPANGLAAFADLSHFDMARFPDSDAYTRDWTNESIRQGAAEQLMPEYVYRGGTIGRDTMEFLMEKPDGTLVFVGVDWKAPDGWSMIESAPLPKGTVYGYENFQSSLFLPQGVLASMKRFADGTWGVSLIYSAGTGGEHDQPFIAGQNWVGDISATHAYGEHPWSDMTSIDWTTLPLSLEEAMQAVDSSGWAVVNNPDPEDRLHLRAAPSREAASLGKYYNNTPVRVLGTDGDWLHVSVFGVEGYMLRRYLAQGDAMNSVASAGLLLNFNGFPTEVYQSPQSEQPFLTISAPITAGQNCMAGIVGDEWYHVWFVDTGLSGYIRQEDMVAGGNG